MDDDTLPAGFELEDPGSSAIPAGFELEATPAAATGSAPVMPGRAQAPLPLALEDTPANDPAAPPPAASSQAPTPQAPTPWASQPLGPAGGQPAGAGVTVRPERGTDTGAFLPDRSPGQGAAGAQANAAAQGLFGGIAGLVSGVGTAIGAGVNSLNRSSMIQMGEPPDAPNTVGMGLAAASQRAGDRLNAETQAEFPVNTRNEGFGTNLARGAGGLAPIVAAGMLPGGAALIPGIIGAQSFDSTYRDAKAHGATDETAFQTGVVNGAVQAGIMSVPLSGALLKVADPLMRDGLIKTALNFAGHGVGFETAAEAGRFVDNVIARQTYDPDRKLMEGVGDQVGENVALSLLVPFAHGLPSLARSVMAPKIDASPELRQGVAGLTEAAQDHQAAVGGDAQAAAPPPEPPAAPLEQGQASPESTAAAVASPEPAQAPLESTPAPASADGPPQTEGADSLPAGFELETPAPALPAAPELAPAPDDLPPGFELEQPAPARQPGATIAGFVQAMRRGESGGRDDARNPGSSASGRFQFLDSTFEQFLRSDANTGGWTMADKNRPAAQDAAMGWLTASNAATLRGRLGRDPTEGELAAAHLLGAHGALALIESRGGSAESALAGVMGADQAREAVARNGRLLHGDAGQALGSIAGYYLGKDAGTPVGTLAGKSVGAPMPVFANGGARIDVQPMLVDLADLTASHDGDGRPNPDYPHAEGLQPRDRSSAASQSQVRSLAANLQPERLAPSSDAGSGAPIVDASGVVESGNGRTMALRQIYTDPQLAPQRDAYRSWLEGQGLDLTGMQQPALVSQRLTPLDAGQRSAFARDANERSTLGMNPAEQARADAARAGRSINLWQGNSAGAASNADFVRDVMAQMSPEERGAMMLPDGTLSAGGERRIQGAVTAHAYGDTMGPTLERFLNGDDAGTKAVAGALADAAGPWAQMRGAAARGEIPPELDITGDLAGAVQMLARARQLGRPVAELAAQTDLDRPPLSAPAQALLGAMFRDPKMKQAAGRDRVASTLQDYATEAMRQTAGQDLFGAPPPTAMAVLEATRRAPDGGASKARLLSMRDAARSAHMVAENADARSITPDVRVARERLATAATALMRYMGLPPEVGLKLVERIVDAATGKASDGSYQRRLIEFALDTRPGQVPFKLFHEIVHGLMDPDLGLVSDGQRRVLEAAAERWLSLGDNRRALAQLYGLDLASPADARVLREEAISQMGEDALARGITQSGSVGWTVRRMKNLVGGFGNLLRGRGFRTADDVFRAMLQGRRASPEAREALAAVGPQNRGMAMLAQAGLPPSLLAQGDEAGQAAGSVEPWQKPTNASEAAAGPQLPLLPASAKASATGTVSPDQGSTGMAPPAPRSKLSQRIADLAAVPDKYMSLRPEPSAEDILRAGKDDPRYFVLTGDGNLLRGPDGSGTLGTLADADGTVRSIGMRRGSVGHVDTPLKHAEAVSAGYRDGLDLIRDVTANYTEIRGAKDGRLMLVKRNGHARVALVELVQSGRIWHVLSGGLRDGGKLDRDTELLRQRLKTTSETATGPQSPLGSASTEASATGNASSDRSSTHVASSADGEKVLRSGLRTDPASAVDGVPVTRSGQSGPDVAPPADGDKKFSLRDAPDAIRFAQKAAGVPGFYSAVARTAALLKQEKGSGPQFAAAIRNAAGVKGEELRWLGVEDWLRNQPSVTKRQVMDFIAANNLGIREVARGDGLPDAALDAADAAEDRVRAVLAKAMGKPAADPAVGRRMSDLLVDPSELEGADPALAEALRGWHEAQRALETSAEPSTQFEDYQLPGGDNYREVLLTLPERKVVSALPPGYQDKTIHEHERDLEMAGQVPFYGDETPEAAFAAQEQARREAAMRDTANFQSTHWAEKNVVAHLRLNDRIAPDGKRVLFVEEVQSDWHQAGRNRGYVGDPTASNASVPDAPFRTSWPALAMKRVLRMAAEDGYDRVAWTTGDTQAKRYAIEGSGMRGFYDKMLPNEVGKIVRPLGGAVARGTIDLTGERRVDVAPDQASAPVHQVEMTPQLRQAALEDGFPLYSLRDSGLKLMHSADERRRGFNDAVRRTLVPITAGAKEAQVAAGRFANAIADVSWRYGQVDRLLVKRFDPAERRAMWDALDEQSLFEIELAEQMAQVPESDRGKMEAAERAAFKGFGMERLPPEQREIVEQLNDLAQQTWFRMKGRGLVNPNADGLPYWAPRFFVKPDLAKEGGETALVREAQQGGSTRAIDPLGMNLKTAKPLDRELRYTEDSIKAMKAKYGDATELVRDIRVVGAALSAEERSIAGVDLVNSIKDYTVKAGVPAITAQPPSWQDADYVEINHPSLKEWVPMMRQLDDGSSEPVKDILGNQVMTRRLMRVHKDYEHPLRAVLTTPQGDFYKAAIKLKGLATAAIMFSPFMHLGVELGRALPALPGTVLSMRWLRDGGRLRADSAFMSDAMRNGLRMVGGSWMQDITGIYDAPNIKPGHGWLAKAMGAMGDLVNAKFGDEIRNAIDRGGERAGEFWHQTMLWDRVADLQVAIYRDMRSRYVAAGFDDKTASIMAAHLANRYAGAMPKEALSTAANKAANLAMFSRSFTLGNLGVMKDMLNGMPGYVRVQIEAHAGDDAAKQAQKVLRRKALSAFVMDIGLFYLTNSLAQNAMQLVSGQTMDEVAAGYVRRAVAEGQKVAHAPWELFNPFGVTESLLPTADNEPGKQDRIWMGNQADGTAIYARLPTGKIGEEFTGWLLSPATMLRNKTSTLVRPTWEAITGRDSLGKPIYDPDVEGIGGLLHNAGRAVMHIVAAQAPFGAIEAAGTIARRTAGAITGGNTPLQGKDLSDAAMQLLPSFLPPPLTAQISHGYPGGPEAGLDAAAQRAQQFTRSQVLPEAKRLLENGDEDGARALLSGAGLDDRAIAGVIRSSNNPGRSRVRVQQQFQRGATPTQQSRLQNITGGSSGLAAAADSLGNASTPDASRMGLGYASPAVPSNAMNQAAQAGIVQAQQMARSAGR